MNVVDSLKKDLLELLKSFNIETDIANITVEKSKDPAHGDYASNIAMKFSRMAGKAPRDFASDLLNKINFSYVDHVEIAGPGFINFFLKNESLQNVISKLVKKSMSNSFLLTQLETSMSVLLEELLSVIL